MTQSQLIGIIAMSVIFVLLLILHTVPITIPSMESSGKLLGKVSMVLPDLLRNQR